MAVKSGMLCNEVQWDKTHTSSSPVVGEEEKADEKKQESTKERGHSMHVCVQVIFATEFRLHARGGSLCAWLCVSVCSRRVLSPVSIMVIRPPLKCCQPTDKEPQRNFL